jgi:hypothetical protein
MACDRERPLHLSSAHTAHSSRAKDVHRLCPPHTAGHGAQEDQPDAAAPQDALPDAGAQRPRRVVGGHQQRVLLGCLQPQIPGHARQGGHRHHQLGLLPRGWVRPGCLAGWLPGCLAASSCAGMCMRMARLPRIRLEQASSSCSSGACRCSCPTHPPTLHTLECRRRRGRQVPHQPAAGPARLAAGQDLCEPAGGGGGGGGQQRGGNLCHEGPGQGGAPGRWVGWAGAAAGAWTRAGAALLASCLGCSPVCPAVQLHLPRTQVQHLNSYLPLQASWARS